MEPNVQRLTNLLAEDSQIAETGQERNAYEIACTRKLNLIRESASLVERLKNITMSHPDMMFLDLRHQLVTPDGLLTCYCSLPLETEYTGIDSHVSIRIREYSVIERQSSAGGIFEKSEIYFTLEGPNNTEASELVATINACGDTYMRLDEEDKFLSSITPACPEWSELTQLVDTIEELFGTQNAMAQ